MVAALDGVLLNNRQLPNGLRQNASVITSDNFQRVQIFIRIFRSWSCRRAWLTQDRSVRHTGFPKTATCSISRHNYIGIEVRCTAPLNIKLINHVQIIKIDAFTWLAHFCGWFVSIQKFKVDSCFNDYKKSHELSPYMRWKLHSSEAHFKLSRLKIQNNSTAVQIFWYIYYCDKVSLHEQLPIIWKWTVKQWILTFYSIR